jgi:hypothetical protein
MTWLLLALLAIPRVHPTSPPSAQAPEPSAQDVQQKVDGYLGAIDTPITDERWRALGPQAAAPLEAVALDPKAFPSRRAKAVEGLAAVAPERAAAIVGKLARDETQPAAVRVAAMRGAAHVLPPEQAVSELKPVLRARSAGMRRTAAEVLSKSPGGCEPVKAQAARESAEHRQAWREALARCRE